MWIPVAVDAERSNSESFDTVTIIFDSARYLPDNVSASKLDARLYNPKRNNYSSHCSIASKIVLDTPVYFPVFETVMLIPARDITIFSVVVVTLSTCDRFTGVTVIIGTVCIPLCIDDGRDNNELQISTGAYQLPILVNLPTREAMNDRDALSQLPRVPCASLLFRVFDSDSNRISILSSKCSWRRIQDWKVYFRTVQRTNNI